MSHLKNFGIFFWFFFFFFCIFSIFSRLFNGIFFSGIFFQIFFFFCGIFFIEFAEFFFLDFWNFLMEFFLGIFFQIFFSINSNFYLIFRLRNMLVIKMRLFVNIFKYCDFTSFNFKGRIKNSNNRHQRKTTLP